MRIPTAYKFLRRLGGDDFLRSVKDGQRILREGAMGEVGRVLIVDDQEPIRHCLEYALDSCGYEVKTCCSAYEALNLCRIRPYDYVVTDYDMPGMNGIELTRRLRTMMPRAVIIGTSGFDRGMDFLQAGANDFRRKPFVPFEIAMMIDGGDLEELPLTGRSADLRRWN